MNDSSEGLLTGQRQVIAWVNIDWLSVDIKRAIMGFS